MYYDFGGNPLSAVYDYGGNVITSAPVFTAFSDMTKTDASGISRASADRTRNAVNAVALSNTSLNTNQTVVFNCNVPTHGERIGFWIYCDRLCVGNFGGSSEISYYIDMTIKANNTSKLYTCGTNGATLRSGMNYYWFRSSEIGDTLTRVEVTIKSNKRLGGSIYLDSVEVGYRMNDKPIIMFNVDASPETLMNGEGYGLFRKYNLPFTCQYLLKDMVSGSAPNQWDLTKHNRLIADGNDFAIYSGWLSAEGEVKPSYDNNYNGWKAHADLMWALGNSVGLHGGSIVHSTGFGSGEAYEKAMCDVGFPIIRADNVQTKDACFASFDDVNYREMKPWFLLNLWTASDAQAIKDAVFFAIQNNLCLQIGFHSPQSADYTPTTNDIYVGVAMVEELLRYVKSKVDANQCEVITSKDFVMRYCPNIRDAWKAERDKSV